MVYEEIYLLEDDMEDSISLRDILALMKKRWLSIIALGVLAMGISAVVSFFFMTPIYQASTQILVSRTAADTLTQQSGARFNEDGEYVETYSVIMKSPYILNQVIEELDLKTTFKELNQNVKVTQEGESQVVTVKVEHEDASQTVIVTNEIANVFQREITQLMGIENVTVLSAAELQKNPIPVKPNPIINIAAGLIVGLVAGVGLALLLDYFDQTIKTEQDVESLGFTILGTVGDIIGDETDIKASSIQTIGRETA